MTTTSEQPSTQCSQIHPVELIAGPYCGDIVDMSPTATAIILPHTTTSEAELYCRLDNHHARWSRWHPHTHKR